MTKTTTTLEKEKLVKSTVDSKIAAVRELIFGESMQEYSQEFDDVYTKIKKQKEEVTANLAATSVELENRITELQTSFEKSIQDLTSDLDQKLQELDEAKADRKKLGQSLEKIALMLQQ
jgi:uncharacterized protein YoxC